MKNNETILITGAAKRIGRHMAILLAKAGYDIAIHYNHSSGDARALQLKISGKTQPAFKRIYPMKDSTNTLYATIADTFKAPSIIINNASVFEEDSIMECNKESWDKHLQVNLRAPSFFLKP